jgi:hypothetical protein
MRNPARVIGDRVRWAARRLPIPTHRPPRRPARQVLAELEPAPSSPATELLRTRDYGAVIRAVKLASTDDLALNDLGIAFAWLALERPDYWADARRALERSARHASQTSDRQRAERNLAVVRRAEVLP